MKNTSFKKEFFISAAVFAFALLFGFLCRFEGFAQKVRPLSDFVAGGLNAFSSLFPFSLAQFALPLFFGGLIFYIIYCIVRKKYFKWIPKVLFAAAYVYFSFVFLHSYAFSLPYASDALPYKIEPHDSGTLAQVTSMIIEDLNEAEKLIEREENGVMVLRDFSENCAKINESYLTLMEKYDFTSRSRIGRAKQAGLLSVPMSYWNTSGFYFMFLGEANVTEDMVNTHIPFITAHEIAHTLGIVRENEANFFAFLSCYESGDSQLRYSALINAYVYSINSLYSADAEKAAELSSTLSENVRDDLTRLNTHLAKYETPIKEAGDSFNDAMLKSSGEKDGIKTYGYMTDLLISYYLAK